MPPSKLSHMVWTSSDLSLLNSGDKGTNVSFFKETPASALTSWDTLLVILALLYLAAPEHRNRLIDSPRCFLKRFFSSFEMHTPELKNMQANF